jgi:tetratricopeptide (TPR) repeat protein
MFEKDPAQRLRHAEKVRELLAEVPEAPETLELRIDALQSILMSATQLGLKEETEFAQLVEEGNALLSRSGDARAHAVFLMGTGARLSMAGRRVAALRTVEQAVARADESGDSELRAVARSGLAMVHMLGGCSDRVLAVVEEGIEILGGAAAAEGDPSPLNPYHRFLSFQGSALATSGRLDEARATLDKALELAAERGDVTFAGLTHSFWASLEVLRGSPSGALTHARQSVEYAERVGAPPSLANAYRSLGYAHLADGQLPEARSALEHALTVSPGSRAQDSSVLGFLAEACASMGDHARAREAAAEAVAIAEREDLRSPLRSLSPALVLRSAHGLAAEREIEAALDRALELIEETGSKVYVPKVHEERAELARLRGDEATRERELREAQRLYTAMGANGHAERLARELDS